MRVLLARAGWPARAAVVRSGRCLVVRRARLHGRVRDVIQLLDDAVPFLRLEHLSELRAELARSADARQEGVHSPAPAGLLALCVVGVCQGHTGGIREPDLDRATRVEGGDLLTRDHLVPGFHGGTNALVDEDDAALLGAVQELVQDSLPRRAGA